MRRLVLTALLALAATACSGKSPEEQQAPAKTGTLDPIDNPHKPGDFDPLPDPEAQGGSVGRAPRRLTVAQLDASLQVTLGRRWSKLDERAASLGRADFAAVVSENTEPNLVFAKFLEDGAREICKAQATEEVNLTDPTARILSRTLPEGKVDDLRKLTDAQVRELLVHLSTRIWGAPLSGDELTKWAGFFTQAATRAETIKKRDQALAAVCIAMLTDSRFITY